MTADRGEARVPPRRAAVTLARGRASAPLAPPLSDARPPATSNQFRTSDPGHAMTHETTTAILPEEVIRRAREFFAGRVPATGAFVEAESPRHVVLRGQGGEEVVIAAAPCPGGSAVRGSTLLFDQQVRRFLSTLPPAAGEAA